MKNNNQESVENDDIRTAFRIGLMIIGIWKLATHIKYFAGIMILDAGHSFGFDTTREGFLLQGTVKLIVGLILIFKSDYITRVVFYKPKSK